MDSIESAVGILANGNLGAGIGMGFAAGFGAGVGAGMASGMTAGRNKVKRQLEAALQAGELSVTDGNGEALPAEAVLGLLGEKYAKL